MRYSLTNIIWYSNKRRNILLLLKEGEKSLDEIKSSLNESSRSIVPHIKKLSEKKLIIRNGDTYCLSEIGELVVENMEPLLNTMRVIEENKDFWITRDFTALPTDLLNRLNEIGHYLLIEPDLSCMFELPREFSDNLFKSQKVSCFISYVHPQIPSMCCELSQMGTSLSLFLTRQVFKKMEADYTIEIKKLLNCNNVEIFMCSEDMTLPTIAVTGSFMYLCFLNDEGRYDHRDIISFDESAVSWANELINYFMVKSERIHFF